MNRSNSILYILGTIVVVAIALLVYMALGAKNVSWISSYEPNDENPYGTKIIYNLMQNLRKDQEFVLLKDTGEHKFTEDPSDKIDSYVFIGSTFYGDSSDVDHLLRFVKNGNNLFLLCENQNNLIFDSLLRSPIGNYEDYIIEEDDAFISEDYYENDNKRLYEVNDSTISLYLSRQNAAVNTYDLSHYYNFEKTYHNWPYFKDSLISYSGDTSEVLGSFDEGYNNYISIPYGRGTIYFHCSPLVFTNYYMLDEKAMNYCRSALEPVGDGKIFWDEDNRTYDKNAFPNNSGEDPSKPAEGPLEFILSEPGLKSAWYLLLLAAFFYLLFGAKRKQRIIKTMENMENTSIEYAGVLSQMFMKQHDHKKLVVMKMEIFKSFLRDRLGIKTPTHIQDINAEFFAIISSKSNVQYDLIKNIFEMHIYHISVSEVETKDMLTFHEKVELFYHQCK